MLQYTEIDYYAYAEVKVCNVCGEYLYNDEDNFVTRRTKQGDVVTTNTCRKCFEEKKSAKHR